jgi:hypothetical protein
MLKDAPLFVKCPKLHVWRPVNQPLPSSSIPFRPPYAPLPLASPSRRDFHIDLCALRPMSNSPASERGEEEEEDLDNSDVEVASIVDVEQEEHENITDAYVRVTEVFFSWAIHLNPWQVS